MGSLKLMVNTATNRVVYAEAGHQTVDFLFSLLEMPIGSMVELVKQEEGELFRSFGNINESMGLLSETYFKTSQAKSYLQNTHDHLNYRRYANILVSTKPSQRRKYYVCRHCSKQSSAYFSLIHHLKCPTCSGVMSDDLYLLLAGGHYGYVKDSVPYIIMDDLSLAPISGISAFKFLSKGDAIDLGALEERVVHLRKDEAFKLLMAAWRSSTTVLIDVFLASQDNHSTVKRENDVKQLMST